MTSSIIQQQPVSTVSSELWLVEIKKLKVSTFCSCEEPAEEASAIHNHLMMSDIQRGGNIARRNEFAKEFYRFFNSTYPVEIEIDLRAQNSLILPHYAQSPQWPAAFAINAAILPQMPHSIIIHWLQIILPQWPADFALNAATLPQMPHLIIINLHQKILPQWPAVFAINAEILPQMPHSMIIHWLQK